MLGSSTFQYHLDHCKHGSNKEQSKNNSRYYKHFEISLLEIPLPVFTALNAQTRGKYTADHMQGAYRGRLIRVPRVFVFRFV